MGELPDFTSRPRTRAYRRFSEQPDAPTLEEPVRRTGAVLVAMAVATSSFWLSTGGTATAQPVSTADTASTSAASGCPSTLNKPLTPRRITIPKITYRAKVIMPERLPGRGQVLSVRLTMLAVVGVLAIALSLLALIVGMFLIYNAMTFSVVQRRELFGTLRGLGVSRGQLFLSVTLEALLIGIVATVIGMALGVGLAQHLVHLVTRTINDVYFAVQVRAVAPGPGILGKAAALGLGATVLAALAPAAKGSTWRFTFGWWLPISMR